MYLTNKKVNPFIETSDINILDRGGLRVGDLIVKSNSFIQAKYNLSIYEQRIILKLSSLIDKGDEEFKQYKLKISEFGREFGFKVDYKKLKKTLINLIETSVEIKHEGKWRAFSLLAGAEECEEKGCLILRFSPMMKPFLLQLKENFTKYNLKYVKNLNNKYSFRIYELLKQYQLISKRKITITELLDYLKVDEKSSYNNYRELNRIILKPVKEDINSHTDLGIDYKKIKLGNKVIAIEFLIRENINKKFLEKVFEHGEDVKEENNINENNEFGYEERQTKEGYKKYMLQMVEEDKKEYIVELSLIEQKHRERIIEGVIRNLTLDALNKEYDRITDINEYEPLNHAQYFLYELRPKSGKHYKQWVC